MKQCTNSRAGGISCGTWKPITDFQKGVNQCHSCQYAKRKKTRQEKMGMKQCTNSSADGISCGTWKPITDFPIAGNQCKSCASAWKKIYVDKLAEERARNGPIAEKQCKECKEVRSTLFFETHSNNKDGFVGSCLFCGHITYMINGAKKRTAKRIAKGREMEEVSVTVEDLKT